MNQIVVDVKNCFIMKYQLRWYEPYLWENLATSQNKERKEILDFNGTMLLTSYFSNNNISQYV